MDAATKILVVGGGVIGLATAIELKLRGAAVTVVSRSRNEAAAGAAAGMLAPSAEAIAPSPMLDLCRRSRQMYGGWIDKLQQLTGIDTGYLPNGILAPVYQKPKSTNSDGVWLEADAVALYQPGLSSEIVGGWWYPEDGQVDNRQLFQALFAAAESLGVEVAQGITAIAFERSGGRVAHLLTNTGHFEADWYIAAGGAWTNKLLPMPVYPVKGQMLSLRMPGNEGQPLPLSRVLYGPNIYLVPRQDGRLLVGATVEKVDWTPGNTPRGIQQLLEAATRLYQPLADWPIEEMWWGYRPATIDELPVLGVGDCENLVLATGHYRNGILLAPATAKLIADLIEGESDPLLDYFSPLRFNRPNSKSTAMTIAQPSTDQISQLKSSSLTVKASEDSLIIAGRSFSSRLMTGTGKYPNLEAMQQSIVSSGCEIVTVAVRRVQAQAAGHQGLAQAIDWNQIWMLPNTAGCKNAEEAVRVARLGREMAKLLGQEDNNFVKLEVIPDPKYLLPDPIGTLEAAEQLVREGFAVLPYINADPILAQRLEEVGCATVMPLGSPIGSGQGIKNAANIAIIIEQAKIPVVVDAGIGTPSEAAYAMELGADALLINSAIALAKNPPAMAQAMGLATRAGRLAYLSGRIPVRNSASASSPLTGTIEGV